MSRDIDSFTIRDSMRRLENEDEEKFWETWVKDDLIFCYRYGKIGSSGHLKIKKFKTRAEAEAELEEKLAEKLAEGFVEAGAEEAEEKEPEESDDADDKESDDDAEEESDKEEDEDEAEADEDEDEAEADEDEAEADEDEDSEDEDEEDEDEEAPKKAPAKKPAPKPVAAVAKPAPPPKATLPTRVPARTPTKDDLAKAKRALEAVTKSAGGRTWKVTRDVRVAASALERLGGVDPREHGDLGKAFDEVMALVIATKNSLPLHAALRLLWEVDAEVVAKTVARWRTKMPTSSASAAVGVLASTFDAVADAEVAVQASAALVDRKLPSDAFVRRFKKVRPFLEESLKKKGTTVSAFLATLSPDKDSLLKARLADAKGVKS